MKPKRAIVVGGGLSGMTTAYRLKQAGFDVTVYEKCPQPEGRNKTVRIGECIVDVSATLMPPSYDQVFALIDELGLNGELEECRGESVTYRDGKFHAVSIDDPNLSLLKSGLISWSAKLSLVKLLWTLAKHRKGFNFYNLGTSQGCDHETLYDYCKRNFPDEVYEYLLNPMHKFLYLHDGTFGAAIELFWWMSAMGSSAPKSFKYGTSTLVNRLAVGIDVRCDRAVQRVTHDGTRALVTVDHQGKAEQDEADLCVITTQAPITAQIYGDALTREQRDFVSSRRYDKVTVVSFCTSKRPQRDVVTIQMPSSQNMDLGVIIFGHKIASTRAPTNKGIVNAYFQHDWSVRHVDGRSDAEVMEAARREIIDWVPEVGQLDGYHVQRWQHTSPIHELGACTKIDAFIESLDQNSPVQIIGDYMCCPSMNVAVTLANRVAERIVATHGRQYAKAA